MNINEVKKILTDDLGFSLSHSEVYIYLLKNIKGTINEIKNNLNKIGRSTIYEALINFEEKNLVTSLGGRNKTYIIEPINKLIDLIDHENDHRKKAVREMATLVNKGDHKKRPPVSFYQGVDGVKKVRKEVLNARGSVVYSIYNWDYVENYLEKTKPFQGEREHEKNINFKDVQIFTSSTQTQKPIANKKATVLFTKKDIGAEITIFDNKKIVFIDYENSNNTIQTIRIENRNIARTLITLFLEIKKNLE